MSGNQPYCSPKSEQAMVGVRTERWGVFPVSVSLVVFIMAVEMI